MLALNPFPACGCQWRCFAGLNYWFNYRPRPKTAAEDVIWPHNGPRRQSAEVGSSLVDIWLNHANSKHHI